MKRRVLVLLAGVVLVAGAGRVFAHHSFTAAYDSTKRIEVEGVVKEFVWRNPHSFVRIDVTNKEGVTETYNLEWGSTNDLTAAKFPVTRTSLKRYAVRSTRSPTLTTSARRKWTMLLPSVFDG